MTETNGKNCKTFRVTCIETAKYEFDVIAEDEDDATDMAHMTLLGDEWRPGALRMDWPPEADLSASWIDREWNASECDSDESAKPVTRKMADAFLSRTTLDDGALLSAETARAVIGDELLRAGIDEPTLVDRIMGTAADDLREEVRQAVGTEGDAARRVRLAAEGAIRTYVRKVADGMGVTRR